MGWWREWWGAAASVGCERVGALVGEEKEGPACIGDTKEEAPNNSALFWGGEGWKSELAAPPLVEPKSAKVSEACE